MPIKTKKYIAFILLFFIIGGFAVAGLPQPAKAQWPTIDIPSIGTWIWEKLQVAYTKIDKQMMATAFKNSLSTFLKKLAYDSAVYVASAGSGQKGLVNPFKGNYLLDLAEGVTGDFVDELAQKSGFASALGTSSLCEPVDLTMKANLLLSFKKPKEPPAPKCSLTKIKQAAQKSAQDNLLEFNAGFEESEGGLNIILMGVNADQNFSGTPAQIELSRISDELTPLLADLREIMGGIAEASIGGGMSAEVQRDLIGMSAQEFADSQLDRLHSIKDKLGEYDGTLFALQENAGKCLGEYSKYGSVCGNGAVSTGEECDIKNNFCSFCKIAGGAGSDCAGPNAQCSQNTTPSSDGMTCLGLGFAPGSGGTVDCDNNCHYKPNCFPTATAECDNAEFMPSCADFLTGASSTMCFKNASFAIQYVGTILGTVSSYLTQVQEWNAKIESKAFDEVGATDPSDIANAFNPEANDMGQFGKIQETLSQKTQDKLEHAKLKTLAEGPCKGVTKPITGEVVTPSAAACAAIDEALAKSTKGQETFTGTVADAFGIFANTLTSKLMERYFKQGLSVVFDAKGLKECKGPDGKDCVSKDKTEDVLRSNATQGGKAQAEAAFGGLLTASIETGGQQDILSILAACPPEQPALNNCIIDEPFRRAIEKQLTVKEAIDAYKKSGGSEGLDPKKPFGYILVNTSAMDEPDFKNGYPYRSMLYLRKYRIIPVGWELAAQYIKDIEPQKNVHTLENVVDGFNNSESPFFGLVDPGWVLKSPTVFCARQGPGPELISEELTCEKFSTVNSTAQCMGDDYQVRKVSRKEWCADEQTCLEEGENGDCKRYGYCTLEKSFWKLGGTQCDKPFASCEGYANTITKVSYTVLENTLNASDCNASNVGCQWYCQEAPKMCVGGTRGGQPCDKNNNNDCTSIYCSVGTCSNNSLITCSYDTDCGTGNKCVTNTRRCVNGDTPGIACTTNAQCGQGVVDGVCEEGGVWSCKDTDVGTCSNNSASSCTKLTENTVCATASETGSCNIPNRINLDRDVKKCEAKNAGCDQFIKVLPGTNLIGNSGFEDDNYAPMINSVVGAPAKSIDQTTIHSGKNSLKINAPSSVLPSSANGLYIKMSALPTGFIFDLDKTYTASAWVYVNSAGSSAALSFGDSLSSNWKTEPTTQTTPQWERISATVTPEMMAQWGNKIPDQIRIYLSVGMGVIYIDDLQLEEGDSSTNYTQYGSSNTVYLNGRRISCEESEIGCKMYSPVAGGAGIPGVINEKDKCSAECSGYKQYRELPAFFSPSRGCEITLAACVDSIQCPTAGDACSNDVDNAAFQNLIPSTASSCPASAVGCEEFTNLDTVASGGEAKEYYTRLRQCAKPGTTTEATFYTWEGSEEAGFQLRAWRLKADGPRPYTTDGSVGCVDTTNPDCRTFYDQTGVIYKEELSSTMFISNDCHPLRKTVQGTRAECAGSGGRTTTAGTGAIDIVTCLYDAIPSQGIRCSAKEAGCREYRGPTANNLRVAFENDFEDLTSQGWDPSYLSSEATTVGGRSYHLHSWTSGDPDWKLKKSVADLVEQDKAYVLEFWAKWNTDENNFSNSNPHIQNAPGNILVSRWYMNARFFGGVSAPEILFPSGVNVGDSGEWNRYVIGPIKFSRSPDSNESIEIFPADANGVPCKPEASAAASSCAGDFYLDNIVLREITDSPYLIKDSWKTPLSCDLDPSDPLGVTNTLEAAMTAAEVGVIDLQDSAGFPDTGGIVVIDGEAIQYTGKDVGDLSKLIGLTRGLRNTTPAIHSVGATIWLLDEGAQLNCEEYKDSSGQTVYLRSFTNLCREDRVGCTEMINTYNSRSIYPQTIKGENILKDSRERVVDNPKLYCDSSFKGCEKMGTPELGQSGEVKSWGETYLINDPDQYDKIACESKETMCSEFVNSDGGTVYFKDPKDALCEYNSSINIDGTITKGWFKKGVVPAALGSLVFYDSDGVGGPDSYAHLECMTPAGIWDATKWTYSCPSDQVGCTEFRSFEAVPQSYYSLNKGVDSSSCTGVIDQEKGCAAFDDKSNPFKMIDSAISGGNAFAGPNTCQKCSEPTVNNICSSSALCNPAKDNCCCNNTANSVLLDEYCDANAILKVKLDRQCAEWLACRTSVEVKDSKGNKLKLCTSRGLCTSATDGNECDDAGWDLSSTPSNPKGTGPLGNRTYTAIPVADMGLRSGFFRAGQNPIGVVGSGVDSIQGYYSYALMSQVGALSGRCSVRTTQVCDLDSQCLSPAGQTCVNRAIVFEDDFETYQSGIVLPQCSSGATQAGICTGDNPTTPADEDSCKPTAAKPANEGICLNYWPTGSAKATNKEFKFGGQSLLVLGSNLAGTPIISKNITVREKTKFALTVWMNTKDITGTAGSNLTVVVETTNPPVSGSSPVVLSPPTLSLLKGNGWTKKIVIFTSGNNTINNPTAVNVDLTIRIYMTGAIGVGSKGYVDMISLAPVLTIQSNPIDTRTLPTNYSILAGNGPAYVERSCRIYAKPDALTCNYRERNTGRQIQGLRGFCAEADPKNPEYCLQWWPIDLISGEDISKF